MDNSISHFRGDELVTNLKRLEQDRNIKMSAMKKDPLLKSCASNVLLEGNKDRSHDGVFLRPGAVTASNSPPLRGLSKRTSVDSGIGVEVNRQIVTRTSKYSKDFQKFSR